MIKTIAIFSRNLNQLRYNKNITIRKLAKEIGYSESTVNNWLYGRRFPSPFCLDVLADYFKIPVSDLFKE